MGKHEDHGRATDRNDGRGWAPAGPEGGAAGGRATPGKRTLTEHGRLGRDGMIVSRLDEARALIDDAHGARLSALRAALEQRDRRTARREAHAVKDAIDEAGRLLGHARQLGGDLHPHLRGDLERLELEHAALRAAASPLLRSAPPPARAVPMIDGWIPQWTGATADGDAEEDERPGRPVTTDTAPEWPEQRATIDAAPAWQEHRATVQRRSRGVATATAGDIHTVAQAGVAGAGGPLPHLSAIQRSFGAHDVSGISAHVGGAAAEAAGAIGAEAYATGDRVAFAAEPSLFVAAHEAAHVVQQRAGVSLLGGVGAEGDAYEHHADAVAERVVRGELAEDLLGAVTHETAAPGVQRKEDKLTDQQKNKSLRLVLRDAADAARDVVDPDHRSYSDVLRAVIRVARALDEARNLHDLHTLSAWEYVEGDLATALHYARELLGVADELAIPAEAIGLPAAIGDLQGLVPRGAMPAAGEDVEVDDLSKKEQLETARLLMGAARERLSKFHEDRGPSEAADRAELVRTANATAQDLAYAADLADRVKRTRDRLKLKEEAEATSSRVDWAAGFIRSGRLPWHPAFAELFDAEANLVERSGANLVGTRPYGGITDPAEATGKLLAIATGAIDATTEYGCATPFRDTQSALLGISASLMGCYDAQMTALSEFKDALDEPDPPKDKSLLSELLEIAVSAVISAGAGAVGALVANATRKGLDSMASQAAESAAEAVEPELRKEVIGKALKAGELSRIVAADAAKDGAKDVFRSAARIGMNAVKRALDDDDHVGATPKTRFFVLQRKALDAARKHAAIALAHLWKPLSQADLATLNALQQSLCELPPECEKLQRQLAAQEWQNFKARWYSGPVDGTKRDADPTKLGIEGVLYLDLEIDQSDPDSPALVVDSITLAGANQATIDYFRNTRMRVRDLAINKQYALAFGPGMVVNVVEGPDLGLHVELIDERDMLVLKAFAKGVILDSHRARYELQAHPEDFADVSDEAALIELRRMIDRAGKKRLSILEDAR